MTDEGGEAACWAHLFDDDSSSGEAVDLAPLLAAAHDADGVQWSLADSADLNVNLVRLGAGGTIARHVNAEVDVAVIVLAGTGTLHVDRVTHALAPQVVAHIPKGAARAIQAGPDGLAYLTVHRRRGALGIAPRAARGEVRS